MTSHERMNAIRDRLVAQGANLATIDAFEVAVREVEDQIVARRLHEDGRITEATASDLRDARKWRGVSFA